MANYWETGQHVLTNTYHPSIAAVDKKIYYSGGSLNSGQNAPINDVYIYDTETDTWSTGTPMPIARKQHLSVCYKSKIYIIGGCTTSDSSIFTPRVDIYDTTSDSWSIGTENPFSIPIYVYWTIIGKDIYCVHDKIMNIYDTEADSWSEIQIPQGYGMSRCVNCNGLIYYLRYESQYQNSLGVYNPETQEFSKIESEAPEFVYTHLGMYFYAGKIYLFSTNTTQWPSTLHAYDIAKDEWTQLEYTTEIDNMGFWGSTIIGNRIYFMGGKLDKTYIYVIEDINIIQKYETYNGETLRPDTQHSATDGELYSATAPAINGYRCTGYRIDDGEVIPGDIAIIADVQGEHTITFLYEEADPSGDANIKLQYHLEDGTKLRDDRNVTVPVGTSYTYQAPEIFGYIIVGWQLDGGPLQTGDLARISEVTGDHVITFIYKEDDGGTTGPGHGDGCCCCGSLKLELNIPINNNLVMLEELKSLVHIAKGCDNSGCCK